MPRKWRKTFTKEKMVAGRDVSANTETLNGKIKYGYVYARSYTEVKIKLNKIKQEITIPAESGTADIIVRTFSEVVKEWITYKTPLLKESSVAKYTNIINLHLLPFFHEQTMQSISVQRLEEFYKKLLLKVTPKGTLLAPKTTLDILSVMKSILVYANTKKISAIFAASSF